MITKKFGERLKKTTKGKRFKPREICYFRCNPFEKTGCSFLIKYRRKARLNKTMPE